MSTKKCKINSVVICDDVRKEDSGKEILIGVYTGKILSHSQPPLHLGKFCIWLGCTMYFTGDEEVSFEVVSPTGQNILGGSGVINVKQEGKTAITLPFYSIHLPDLGTYSIRFGLGQSPRKIGEFEVEYEPK